MSSTNRYFLFRPCILYIESCSNENILDSLPCFAETTRKRVDREKVKIRDDSEYGMWLERGSRIYRRTNRIWSCSSHCPRSPQGRPRNPRNPPFLPSSLSRSHSSAMHCQSSSGLVSLWPGYGYWRGRPAAEASTAETPEDASEGIWPRSRVPRLSRRRL